MPRVKVFRMWVPQEQRAWRTWRARVAAYDAQYLMRDVLVYLRVGGAWEAFATEYKRRDWPLDKRVFAQTLSAMWAMPDYYDLHRMWWRLGPSLANKGE